MRALRNALVIMALAFAVAFLPAGGNVADTVLTAISIAFLTAIAWGLFVFSRQQQLHLAALGDARRALLYGALGTIALLIAGTDELFASGIGTLLWIALLGGAIAAIWRVWADAANY